MIFCGACVAAGTRVGRRGGTVADCCAGAEGIPVGTREDPDASCARCCRRWVAGSVGILVLGTATATGGLCSVCRRVSSSRRASSSARARSICSRSAFCRASRSARSRMIIRGPRITCWGDPVWAGGAVGRVVDAPWPLVVAGLLPPPIRSAIEAFSSTGSAVKG